MEQAITFLTAVEGKSIVEILCTLLFLTVVAVLNHIKSSNVEKNLKSETVKLHDCLHKKTKELSKKIDTNTRITRKNQEKNDDDHGKLNSRIDFLMPHVFEKNK